MARKALLAGINRYPNPAHALYGCVNDVRQVRDLLRDHYGFGEAGNLQVLLDGEATTAAIRDGLARLVDGARAGDLLVFHYSGHGSQVPDADGDETADGLDEIICPYDLDWDDPFTDDDLGKIAATVPAGALLAVVLDCCHSGTGLREPRPRRGRDRFMCPPETRAAAGDGRGSARGGLERSRLAPRVNRFGRQAEAAGALLIAGCRSDQSSADAFIGGAYHGALTYFLGITLEVSGYRLSYARLVAAVRASLRRNGFDQEPQLEALSPLRHLRAFEPPNATADLALAGPAL